MFHVEHFSLHNGHMLAILSALPNQSHGPGTWSWDMVPGKELYGKMFHVEHYACVPRGTSRPLTSVFASPLRRRIQGSPPPGGSGRICSRGSTWRLVPRVEKQLLEATPPLGHRGETFPVEHLRLCSIWNLLGRSLPSRAGMGWPLTYMFHVEHFCNVGLAESAGFACAPTGSPTRMHDQP